jgi:hypothetical protein
MKLKIKEEFKGQLITRRFIGRGEVVIDTTKNFTQSHMKNLYNGGFSDLFEYYNDEVIVEDKPLTKEKKKNGKTNG